MSTVDHAAIAGLRHSSDCEPGIVRRRAGTGFSYRHADGSGLTAAERSRVEALKIPPAWTDVWICADPRGHIQATGRDSKGRKQYLYHLRWREVRDADKFDRVVAFGEALPAIRAHVDADLRRRALSRERVIAAVVGIMDRTLARVGNAEYERANSSFGLTTLKTDHVRVRPDEVRMRFRGKSGKVHALCVDDPRIVRAIRRLRELPGQELFQYLDADGHVRDVTSADVNEYLREISGGAEITSKDFRTWGGTLAVAEALATSPVPDSRLERERAVVAAVRQAASLLGNTPAVCRRSYVHPAILEHYIESAMTLDPQSAPTRDGLRAEESALLELLATQSSSRATAVV